MTSSQTRPEPSADRDRYRTLLETSRKLSATLSADELYEAIYAETADAVDASAFYLALHDQSRDLARIVFYADNGTAEHVDLQYRGSDSEIFRTQKAYIVDDDLESDSILVLGDNSSGVARSAVTAPLVLNGRLIGAISAQSYDAGAYDEDDLELVQGIADIAAVALNNAIQFKELERRRREAERLEELGRALTSELDPQDVLDCVIDAVQELLPIDGTAVWLCDFARTSVARVGGSGGDIALPVGLEWDLSGELRERLEGDRKPVILDNLEATDLPTAVAEHMTGGSAIGVPVVVQGRVEGVLTAGSREPRSFGREDAAVLQRLANQFAVAMSNARLHADVRDLSLTDPLTGLPNRRRLQIHLDHEVAAARRGRPLAIAMIDIDRFKHYNDTFGHVAGDEILKAVARLLAEENRAMNVVARFGGDEFVSVLSETGIEGARHYVERVRERVLADATLKKFDISLSMGCAAFDADDMATVNDILRAADGDMYAAKAETERAAG